MNFENEELRKLEEELEGKLKGQTLPKKVNGSLMKSL